MPNSRKRKLGKFILRVHSPVIQIWIISLTLFRLLALKVIIKKTAIINVAKYITMRPDPLSIPAEKETPSRMRRSQVHLIDKNLFCLLPSLPSFLPSVIYMWWLFNILALSWIYGTLSTKDSSLFVKHETRCFFKKSERDASESIITLVT